MSLRMSQRSHGTPLETLIFVPYGIKSFDLIMINLRMKFYKYFTFKNGWEIIMINNYSLRKWDRLAKKQLNQQFLNEIIQGLNCSSFEASAILETVHKVYAPYFGKIYHRKRKFICESNRNQSKI